MDVEQSLDLTKLKPGIAVIFNFMDFDEGIHKNKREGSQHDLANIKSVFLTMGLSVQLVSNANLKEFSNKCKQISNDDFSEYASLFLIFMSHGDEMNILFCKDGKFNVVKESQNMAKNPTLKGKPKYLIVEACRGTFDVNDTYDSGDPRSGGSEITAILTSSFEGFVSYMSPDYGSPFIRSYCTTLRENWYEIPYEKVVLKFRQDFLNSGRSDQQCPTYTQINDNFREFSFKDFILNSDVDTEFSVN